MLKTENYFVFLQFESKSEKMMRAIEFKSKIRENKISLPRRIQSEMLMEYNKSVRVVIFLEDTDVYDDKAYRQMTKSQFLKGYTKSDAIYDEYF